MPTEPKPEPNDTVSLIQKSLNASRTIHDMADPIRDIGMTVDWLRLLIEHALKVSVYRDTFLQTQLVKPLPKVTAMLAEDIGRHVERNVGSDELPIAKDVPVEQLRAVLGAIRSLEGAAWAVQAAAEILGSEK